MSPWGQGTPSRERTRESANWPRPSSVARRPPPRVLGLESSTLERAQPTRLARLRSLRLVRRELHLALGAAGALELHPLGTAPHEMPHGLHARLSRRRREHAQPRPFGDALLAEARIAAHRLEQQPTAAAVRRLRRHGLELEGRNIVTVRSCAILNFDPHGQCSERIHRSAVMSSFASSRLISSATKSVSPCLVPDSPRPNDGRVASFASRVTRARDQ